MTTWNTTFIINKCLVLWHLIQVALHHIRGRIGHWWEKLKRRWPMHGAPVNTTQEWFRCRYYMIPGVFPAHPRASQTFHHQPYALYCPLFPPQDTPSSLPPFLTPSPCQTPLLSVLFHTSCTLPSAWFMSLGRTSVLQSMNRHQEQLPYTKPSYHPSAALQHLPL